ncbi:MAG: dockerin type I repeat-containing protein [Vampirovibrionia bacterium]
MSLEDLNAKLPPEIQNLIGKEFKKRLPDGRIIKFILGDVTGDGKIDDEDIAILKLLANGGTTAEAIFEKLSPEQLAACDITRDGYINRSDLLELCKSIVNKNPDKKIENKLTDLRNKVRKNK